MAEWYVLSIPVARLRFLTYDLRLWRVTQAQACLERGRILMGVARGGSNPPLVKILFLLFCYPFDISFSHGLPHTLFRL